MNAAEPRVLLIHGFASNSRDTWQATGWTAALEEAGRAWTAPDLPGHGDAAKPHEPDAYRVSNLLEYLLEAIGEEPIDVVGYSMGGALALELALSHPQLVRRLVAGGFDADDAVGAAAAQRLFEEISAGRQAPQGGAAMGLWESVVQSPGADTVALAACLAGFAASDRRTDYDLFPGPTLLFGGTEDPLASGLPELARRLPRAQLEMLPRRDHRTAVSTGRLRRQAVAFLAEVPA
jgi:pimeloyl-ACP methyl ester carboxylesterase